MKSNVVTMETIASKIHLIRGIRVMLDADLAELYGVTTKALNQAVTRNGQRFPPDFMFRLAKEEKQELVTNCDRLDRLKHSSALPRVFTEQGVAMLSSVLRSERAIYVNIQVMRVFTRLRQMVLDNEELRKELEDLKRITDERFQIVFETLDQLINIRVRILANFIVPEYVGFRMFVEGQSFFSRNAQQVVGMASISQPQLASLPIPLPPFDEQEKIVEIVEQKLSVMNEVEGEIEKNLKRSESLRQSILKKAFTGKLTSQDNNGDPIANPLKQSAQVYSML